MSITVDVAEFNIGSVGFFVAGTNVEVASLSGGRVLVTFEELTYFPAAPYTDSDGGVFARVFDDQGVALTDTFQVNTTITQGQYGARAAQSGSNEFVILWTNSAVGGGFNDTDTHLRAFDATTYLPVTGEVVETVDDPVTGTLDDNDAANILSLENGGIVVLSSVREKLDDGSIDTTIQAQIYGTGGAPQGDKVEVAWHATFMPDIVQLSNGDVVVGAVNERALRVSAADMAGAPKGIAGATEPVFIDLVGHTNPASVFSGPAQLAALADGGFAVVYRDHPDTNTRTFQFELFAADGTAEEVFEIPAPDFIGTEGRDYSLIGLQGGGFALGYVGNDADGFGIYLQAFHSDGSLNGAALRINTTETGNQTQPSLIELDDGRVWVSFTDGSVVGLNGNPADFARGVIVEIAGNDGPQEPDPVGTEGADAIDGTVGDDVLDALGGDDTINGSAGADTLIGGDGLDVLDYSGSGAGVTVGLAADGSGLQSAEGGDAEGDVISGFEHVIGSGFADVLTGSAGIDTLDGGDGNDTLTGNGQADQLKGGAGDDVFDGRNGNDYVYGGTGNDLLVGWGGRDRLRGNAGDDTMIGGNKNDFLQGGSGADVFVFNLDNGAWGKDYIKDFEQGVDRVQVEGFSAEDVSWKVLKSGLGVMAIVQGGGKIVFNGYSQDQLDDFVDWDFLA